MSMTWGEFKRFIDEQLVEAGGGDDTEIWYIDVSFPQHPSKDNKYGMDVPEAGISDMGLSVH